MNSTTNTTQTNLPLPDPSLKPERVQLRLRRERAQELVKTLPGWELTADAKAVHRAKQFPTPEIASLFGTFVTGFAGALSLPVAVHHSSGGQVVVTLTARPDRGRLIVVTEAVLDFARRLG
jgi:pterin-4a-carbinolamine dehydratase